MMNLQSTQPIQTIDPQLPHDLTPNSHRSNQSALLGARLDSISRHYRKAHQRHRKSDSCDRYAHQHTHQKQALEMKQVRSRSVNETYQNQELLQTMNGFYGICGQAS